MIVILSSSLSCRLHRVQHSTTKASQGRQAYRECSLHRKARLSRTATDSPTTSPTTDDPTPSPGRVVLCCPETEGAMAVENSIFLVQSNTKLCILAKIKCDASFRLLQGRTYSDMDWHAIDGDYTSNDWSCDSESCAASLPVL